MSDTASPSLLPDIADMTRYYITVFTVHDCPAQDIRYFRHILIVRWRETAYLFQNMHDITGIADIRIVGAPGYVLEPAPVAEQDDIVDRQA